MEPSRRNQWQPVASAGAAKTAETSEIGKEGVDGSSPSEGFCFLAGQTVVAFSR
jgi:hypothetical protein